MASAGQSYVTAEHTRSRRDTHSRLEMCEEIENYLIVMMFTSGQKGVCVCVMREREAHFE